MFGIGGPELVVILIVGLIFIGPDKLPKVAKTVGAGLRDLRRAANVAQAELKETMDDLVREADLDDVLRDRTETLDKQAGRDEQANRDEQAGASRASQAGQDGSGTDPASIDPPARRPDPGGFHLDDDFEDDDDGSLVGRSAFADDDDNGGDDERPDAPKVEAARRPEHIAGAGAASTLSDRLGGKLKELSAREEALAERQAAAQARERARAEADAVPPMPDPHSLHRVPDLSGIEDTMPRRRVAAVQPAAAEHPGEAAGDAST